jgi:hypothetical protein
VNCRLCRAIYCLLPGLVNALFFPCPKILMFLKSGCDLSVMATGASGRSVLLFSVDDCTVVLTV